MKKANGGKSSISVKSYVLIVYGGNQVLVSGGNRNQGPMSVSVLEPKLYFLKPKKKVSKSFNFSHVSHFFLGDISFYKLKNKPRFSKII